jgi:hypothetical protein
MASHLLYRLNFVVQSIYDAGGLLEYYHEAH